MTHIPQVQVTDTEIIVNPEAKEIDALPSYYAGILAIGSRMAASGMVLDVEAGVVKSDTDPMKVYVYDENTGYMVAASPVRNGRTTNYRKWQDENGRLMPSLGYTREFKTTDPETNEVRISVKHMAYDSHHIAWLLAQGLGFKVKRTEWAEKRLYQENLILAGGSRKTVFAKEQPDAANA